jgi:hypothetical protein
MPGGKFPPFWPKHSNNFKASWLERNSYVVRPSLCLCLSGDDLASASAREVLRALIDRVVVTPAAGGATIDLIGDLAGILHVASGGAIRGTAVLGEPSDQHIAGPNNHRKSSRKINV